MSLSQWNKHYHWKTKGCTAWAKSYFQERLVGQSASTPAGTVSVKSLDSFEGDVELGNRKGKLITIYDCAITYSWAADDDEARGTVTFPEVSHEVQDDGAEYQFETAVTNAGSKDRQQLLQAVREQLIPVLLPHFHSFRAELIKQHANDLGHEDAAPSSAGNASAAAATSSATATAAAEASKSDSAAAKPKAAASTSTKVLRTSADLAIKRDDLWNLLTDPSRIPMWTRAPAQFELKEGASFSLFGGNVSGTIQSVQAPAHLVQSWRLSQWPQGHFAELTLDLSEESESTKLDIALAKVPTGEEDASENGIETFYIRSLKQMGLGLIL